ncbi:hypothetical protein [Streptomyces lydicus]|uniref:hypothetical protein n=1 Tax=Streptomyces lydicus TaxID=47763 RepID=UPI0013DDD57C|nr:hypothetical protein [Streptomyces lydicus]
MILMVFSIQYGFWAISYWNDPGQRLEWNPAATLDLGQLLGERHKLANNRILFSRIRKIADRAFRLGLAFFLLSLALLLLPPGEGSKATPDLIQNSDVSSWRHFAGWSMGCALFVEIWWGGTALLLGVFRWLNRKMKFGCQPPIGRFRLRVAAVAGGLSTFFWRLGKPVSPDRWTAKYIAMGRPEMAGVQALLENAQPMPDEFIKALNDEPEEWPIYDVVWEGEDSVKLTGGRLQGRIWTTWPWGLFGSNGIYIVVHPFGAIKGKPGPVRRKLVALRRRYFKQGDAQLDKALVFLEQYEGDAGAMGL